MGVRPSITVSDRPFWRRPSVRSFLNRTVSVVVRLAGRQLEGRRRAPAARRVKLSYGPPEVPVCHYHREPRSPGAGRWDRSVVIDVSGRVSSVGGRHLLQAKLTSRGTYERITQVILKVVRNLLYTWCPMCGRSVVCVGSGWLGYRGCGRCGGNVGVEV